MQSPAFEKWYAEYIKVDLERVEAMWCHDANTYVDYTYRVEDAWAAWCAALGFVKSRA